MNDTLDRDRLENEVRAALSAHATSTFPEQAPPPFAGAATHHADAPLHRRWLAPALAAAAAAAVLVGTVTAVHQRGGSRTAPLGTIVPPARTAVQSPPTAPVPEAPSVSGVRIVAPSAQDRTHDGGSGLDVITFEPVTGSLPRLTAGHRYPFTAHLGYRVSTSAGLDPLVLIMSATNAVLACPSPFLVRTGHAYDISCVITPLRGTGSVTMSLTGLDGAAHSQATSPAFTARP